jgi:glycosyltransferase involved in cell wall biosynthesis
VIDFRDGWLDDPYTKYPTWLHVKGHQYLEKKILERATTIIVYGQVLQDRFEARYPGISKKIQIIPNGFDPEDFLALNPIEKNKNKVRFVYSGNLYGNRKQNFEVFLKALNLLPKDVAEKIEVIVVGPAFDGIKEIIDAESLSEKIKITGYLPHLEALNYLTSADVGIVFLPPNELTGVTGKVFEYIGLGHTVLACVEKEGACSNLLKSIDSDLGVCQPDNPKHIADTILKLNELNWPRIKAESAMQFSRKYHTSLLAKILESSISV